MLNELVEDGVIPLAIDLTQLERVIADKAALRRRAREQSWPEKVAMIERLRDTTRLAREAMRRALAEADKRNQGNPSCLAHAKWSPPC